MSRHRRDFPYQGAGLAERDSSEVSVQEEDNSTEIPDEPSLPDGEEEGQEPEEQFSPETFLLMDNAPKDGTLLQVKMDPDADDSSAQYAVWRSTTMFDKELRRWRRIGYWADPITKRQIDGEPIVYRLASAGPILGLIT